MKKRVKSILLSVILMITIVLPVETIYCRTIIGAYINDRWYTAEELAAEFGPEALQPGWVPPGCEPYDLNAAVNGGSTEQAPIEAAPAESTPAENAPAESSSSSSPAQTLKPAAPKEPEITIEPISGNFRPFESIAVYSDKKGTEEAGTIPAWTLIAVTGETSNGLFLFEFEDSEGYARKDSFVTNSEYMDAWEISEEVEPSCTSEGKTVHTNSLSGESYEDLIPLVDHKYELDSIVDPTCTEKGVKIFKCKNCEDSYTEDIAAEGHDDGFWIVTTPSKAFSEGLEELRCTKCMEVLKTRSIPQTFPLSLTTFVILIVVGSGVVLLLIILAVILRKKKKIKITIPTEG